MNKFICGVLVLVLSLSFGFAYAQEQPVEAIGESSNAVKWSFPISPLEINSEYYLVISEDNLLSEDYEPQTLAKAPNSLRATSADAFMDETALLALTELITAAKAVREYTYTSLDKKGEQVEDSISYEEEGMLLYIKSGYRKYGTQKTVYANYLAKNDNVDNGAVEKPGASEHQSGLCADVVNGDYASRSTLTEDFQWTAEAQWLKENCALYGFILRYPEDKVNVTGHAFEPWHLRYVGVNAATYIMENELTLNEFTDMFLSKYEKFIQDGGDVNSVTVKDLNMLPSSYILDVHGDDGDNDVSISF
ncbi:MAG: M15 family metallopeptidase [Clostridiales bacterium]|nr:M15 family metallopeptidase [Clostridiales bacterium]